MSAPSQDLDAIESEILAVCFFFFKWKWKSLACTQALESAGVAWRDWTGLVGRCPSSGPRTWLGRGDLVMTENDRGTGRVTCLRPPGSQEGGTHVALTPLVLPTWSRSRWSLRLAVLLTRTVLVLGGLGAGPACRACLCGSIGPVLRAGDSHHDARP